MNPLCFTLSGSPITVLGRNLPFPLLNPVWKAKPLPSSSIFPDSPCPWDKLLSFQKRGMQEEGLEKPCLAMGCKPFHPDPQVQKHPSNWKVFAPRSIPISTAVPSDKGQSWERFWSSPGCGALLLTSAGSGFHPVICLCCRSGVCWLLTHCGWVCPCGCSCSKIHF